MQGQYPAAPPSGIPLGKPRKDPAHTVDIEQRLAIRIDPFGLNHHGIPPLLSWRSRFSHSHTRIVHDRRGTLRWIAGTPGKDRDGEKKGEKERAHA
jgi:hypothetical protein